MALARSGREQADRPKGSLRKNFSETLLPKNLSETCLKAFGKLRGIPKNLSQNCLSSGLQLNYDTFGERRNPAVLLIMGLAAQKVRYPGSFCQRVADSGYFVIRFDNRDCGGSGRHYERVFERISCLVGLPMMVVRNAISERRQYFLFTYLLLGWLAWRQKRRRYKWMHAFLGLWSVLSVEAARSLSGPYSCEDLALDCVRLLDSLDIVHAHIVGFSMGGMIAQTFARMHPRRCLSLVLMSTCHPNSPLATANLPFLVMHGMTTGDAFLPFANADKKQKALERFWKNLSTQDSYNLEGQRKLALEEVSRGSMDIDAYLRQVMAVLKFTDGTVKVPTGENAPQLPPTLVIHGADDPLIPIQHGLELAKLMKSRNCVILPSYGHDVLPGAENEVFAAVIAHLSDVTTTHTRPSESQANWAAVKKSPSMALLTLAQ